MWRLCVSTGSRQQACSTDTLLLNNEGIIRSTETQSSIVQNGKLVLTPTPAKTRRCFVSISASPSHITSADKRTYSPNWYFGKLHKFTPVFVSDFFMCLSASAVRTFFPCLQWSGCNSSACCQPLRFVVFQGNTFFSDAQETFILKIMHNKMFCV